MTPRSELDRRSLLKAAGVGAAALTLPQPRRMSERTRIPKRAYYYLWWSKQHWHDKLGPNFPYHKSPLPLPATLDTAGCHAVSKFPGNKLTDVPAHLYTQDRQSVIDKHVRQAVSAGLDGFIVNWRGAGSLTQGWNAVTYTSRLVSVVDAARRSTANGRPFDLWLSYKAADDRLPASYIIRDLRWLHSKLGDRSVWDRRGGRPIVVWSGSHHYPLSTLMAVSDAVRGKWFLVGDESLSSITWDRLRQFDGLTYYWSSQNPYANPQSFSQIRELAHKAHSHGKPWFAPFAPGFQYQLEGGGCVPRRHGETLHRLFEGNLRSEPQAMCLISWNEITEGTYIEPLRRYGLNYVRHTARL